MPSFTVLEIDLIRQSGLTRDILRTLRLAHLQEGVDFGKNGRWIAYSNAAAARLLALSGAPEFPPPAPGQVGQKNAPPRLLLALPPVPGTVMKLLAWRTAEHGLSNDYILEAYLPGSNPHDRANIVRVRVASNRNFTRDMELWARLDNGDLYDLWDPQRNKPQAPPRARGRW